jgi:K+-sensing histidine kinase KdpD
MSLHRLWHSQEASEAHLRTFFSDKEATGVGLRLWVSEGILLNHDARIQFRNHTGPTHNGTMFSIKFEQN